MISVITPTAADPARMLWLSLAHASLHENDADFVHVIVVDGANESDLPVSLRSCPNTRVLATSTPVGAAAARNLGLWAAPDGYVTSLDDDDILPAGSLDVKASLLDTTGLGSPVISLISTRTAVRYCGGSPLLLACWPPDR